jgi:hypothetical protein
MTCSLRSSRPLRSFLSSLGSLGALALGLSLIGLPLLFASPAAAQRVDDEISSYTDVRRVKSAELRDIRIESYPGNDAALKAEYVSRPGTQETTWALSFYGFASEPTSMSAAQSVQILADGSPLQPLRVESKSRTVDGDVIEIKTVFFSRPIFARIAAAETVEVTIGAAKFTAPRNTRIDMELILNAIPGKDGRRTAANDNR